MANAGHEHHWGVMGKTVRGASHVRANLGNQDAIMWLPETGGGPPLILAVSDGHGSAKCFRSDEGARRGVTTAVAVLHEFVSGAANLSLARDEMEVRLPRALVRSWSAAVQDHLQRNPVRPEERETLLKKEGPTARDAIDSNPLLVYGATLLAAVVTDTFIMYLQLGDGDIVVVSEAGQVERPLPRDVRLFANETTSLSSPKAWQEFRFELKTPSSSLPALILLSTDGYANSFRSPEGFLQVGGDVLNMMLSHGVEAVQEGMESWLTEASQVGSGDDITLGIVYREEAILNPAALPTPTQLPGAVGEPASDNTRLQEDPRAYD